MTPTVATPVTAFYTNQPSSKQQVHHLTRWPKRNHINAARAKVAQNIEKIAATALKRPAEERRLVQPYKQVYYFFYGTLTQPRTLSPVLDLEEQPALRPSRITGYALANWGQYRALVGGEPGQEVADHAYLVQSAEDEHKLARYETDAYEAASCEIRFTDGRDTAVEHGMTFRYAGTARL